MTDKPQSLNLEQLIKLLKMTTTSNDNEALLFMRKANEQLQKFGGDWEALLRGKVTVIADPFTSASAAPPLKRDESVAPPPPPRPAPVPQPKGGLHWHQVPPHQPGVKRAQAAFVNQQRMKAAAAAAQSTPAPTRNTLRKQRVQLDDLA